MKERALLYPNVCPVCKRKFYPAPQHSWKIYRKGVYRLVCTYSCMRKFEREQEAKGVKSKSRIVPRKRG